MTHKTKIYWLLAILTALLLTAAQCNAKTETEPGKSPPTELSPVALKAGQKLKVVATTSIIADIVKNVGGDAISLNLLLPVGTDPHTFDPAPRDLATVADADVIFANGLGLEAFLDELLSNAGGQAILIPVTEGIKARQFTDHLEKEDDQGADGHNEAGSIDPHAWTSPSNALVFVDNIQRTLSALDPANAESYRANAAAYKTQLQELDAWAAKQIESIPPQNRELVTDHTAFGYYADRYGLKQIGAVIPSFSTAAEPSAKDLADLEAAISKFKVKAIFVGASVNPALSRQVAQDTGVKLLKLYTGSLGPAGSGVETYLDYIRYNTNTIVEGLK